MMLDQLYGYLGTRDIPGDPEALERLATRGAELADMNGRSWVRANRQILLMQWQLAIQQIPAGEVAATGEEKIDE
jgi:hypothetical protein